VPENVPGIHHLTSITGDVQKCVDFYVSVLGLRFVKQSVNFDVPDTYHIYFGDRFGTPGTAMTFFGWHHLPWRRAGNGQVTVIAFAVPERSLDFWSGRLRELGVASSRSERFGAGVIALRDPDQIQIELVGQSSDDRWSVWPDSPVGADDQIRGFHSVLLSLAEEEPTARFLSETMGFRALGREDGRVRFGTGPGGPNALLDIVTDPKLHTGEEATGTVHHVAWRALDDAHEVAWREALVAAGRTVTPVIERKYFRSIYSREPGGVLFEIATDKPGFTVDEPEESLGSGLQLPPQHEHLRDSLKVNLAPIAVPATTAPSHGR
jgi:glyoxalase family protein